MCSLSSEGMSFSFLFSNIQNLTKRGFTMSIGANIPDRVKTELNLAIAEAARTYQKENDRYFSRNRILDVETMMKQMIAMQGGSLQKELHEAGISATASAFVQSRKKLSWMDFENVLEIGF